MPAQRISHEPAYVLHHHDWSESSLILDVFTRQHGRVALVAKGAKKPSSNFRPVLLPLQPLQIAFGGDAEIRTLKGAEWMGGHTMPTGDALMSGYYLNELLIRLLARDDPHPRLFDSYAATVQLLATDFARSTAAANAATPMAPSEGLPLALRAFELLLLREIGLLPALGMESATLAELAADTSYVLMAKAACAPPMPTTAPACPAPSGWPCKPRSTTKACPTRCCSPCCAPAPRCWHRCAASCAPCCTTIAACQCCAPARS